MINSMIEKQKNLYFQINLSLKRILLTKIGFCCLIGYKLGKKYIKEKE